MSNKGFDQSVLSLAIKFIPSVFAFLVESQYGDATSIFQDKIFISGKRYLKIKKALSNLDTIFYFFLKLLLGIFIIIRLMKKSKHSLLLNKSIITHSDHFADVVKQKQYLSHFISQLFNNFSRILLGVMVDFVLIVVFDNLEAL